MQFVPIPTSRDPISKDDPRDFLDASFEQWFPFLEGISRRSKEPIDQLLKQIANRDVQLALAWDGSQPLALFGIRFVKRGDDLIGEICWLTGRQAKRWLCLLPQLEQYLRDMGCKEIRPICRPGWARLILNKSGYKATHYQMEKVL